MAKQSREILKEYFKRGEIPQEQHFADLIDSMYNLKDDPDQPKPEPPAPSPQPPLPPVPPYPSDPYFPTKIIEVPANGKWHDLTEWKNTCCAYAVMAGCGSKVKQRFALIHAIAMHCFDSKLEIKKTRSWYMFFPSKLQLRWENKADYYALQIRTRRNYGSGIMIRCKLTELWGEQDMDAIGIK